MRSRPDIVFLVLDTQRADRLSCYGYPRATSPHLDALAADSTLFRYAFSPAQWTVPSHASMFTGVFPSVHGTRHSHSVLPTAFPSLAERLNEGGYLTTAFCNNPLVGVVNNGLRRGFFSFLNYSGLMTSRPNQAGSRPSLIGAYRQLFKRFLGTFVHRVQDSFARSDALLSFAFTPFMVPIWQTALSFKGNTAKSLNDAARLHIERRNLDRDQPIFSFINLMGTHMPFHPKPQFIERFAPQVLRDKSAQRYLRQFNGDVFGWLAPLTSLMGEEHKATLDGMYDAEVATQDEHLGAFFAKLRLSGALDNTLLIICADHGEHLGEKHFMGHSVSLYRELTHVPLIVRDPTGALPRGKVLEQPVSTRRIFHTALTAAGAADVGEQRLTLLRDSAHDPEQGVVFAEAITSQNVLNVLRKYKPELVQKHHCDQPRWAIWRKPYKLLVTGDQQELYDFVADPAEMHDLRPAMPDQAATLYALLRSFVEQSAVHAVSAERMAASDDPHLHRRLRALGYLE